MTTVINKNHSFTTLNFTTVQVEDFYEEKPSNAADLTIY